MKILDFVKVTVLAFFLAVCQVSYRRLAYRVSTMIIGRGR